MNKIYCVFCGRENNLENKKCTECRKKLNPKESPILDYLKKHISDDLMGKTTDTALSIITSYIKSHLYGIILSMSLIVSSGFIIISTIDKPHYKEVTSKPNIVSPKVTYSGAGMDPNQLAMHYVTLLSEGNNEAVLALQEQTNTYPVFRLYENSDFITNEVDISKIQVTGTFPNAVPIEGYTTSSVTMEYIYCQEQNCTDTTNNITFVFIVEMLNKDGNWYVFNDDVDFGDDDITPENYTMLREADSDLQVFLTNYYN